MNFVSLVRPSWRRASTQTGKLALSYRHYAQATPSASAPAPSSSQPSSATESTASGTTPRSACLPGTVLEGLTWLKDQKPVLAKPDEEYPPWLWSLTDKKVEDPKKSSSAPPPGSRDAQRALRKANRKSIKASNFMKAQ
ncbi:hypothetical protein FRC04_010941 [Tulasnella sp. 424]|nr:hypothetical protein FRC04_010941 [Tulasnella sp. 424]KAG8975697.1 hypothetical protein FRC05_005215 [Tulasnella sp. 425]